MNTEAIGTYERALRQAAALDLVTADGSVVALAIGRYLADADDADRTVVRRAVPPVLDVGCGPGRIVQELAASGLASLGVDIAEAAIALTNERGAPALMRDVFDRVPGEGRWPTIVVLDGNIGIGGDVVALLRRLTQIMAAGGQLLIEASEPDGYGPSTDEVLLVRFRCGTEIRGPEFLWARVDVDAVVRYAAEVGLAPSDRWSAGGRSFVRLVRNTDAA
jgi:SAM-dependent methyltransferase